MATYRCNKCQAQFSRAGSKIAAALRFCSLHAPSPSPSRKKAKRNDTKKKKAPKRSKPK